MTIVIVGTGEAGVSAAGTLREQGFAGRVVLVGQEVHHPYARPPLSKAMLVEDAVAAEPIRSAAWLAERDIEVRLGTTVESIDPSARRLVVGSGGERENWDYDQLLLATGAQPRRLASLDHLGDRVSYLRTYDDGLVLRQRLARSRSVVIVGGGVIGLETASSARRLGCDVVVIEPADRLMARAMSPCGSDMLLSLHRGAGVDVRLRTHILAAERSQIGATLTLSDSTMVEVETLVVAIGVQPDDRLARQAGCRVDNGIVVGADCATSVANIFAAGDVARFVHPVFDASVRIEAWQHARRHGAHAARAMLGGAARYAEIPWFWTDQHGVNVQVAGLPDQADVHIDRGATILHMMGDRLVAATTVDNGRDMRPCMTLIAAGWRGDRTVLSDPSRTLAAVAKDVGRSMAA